MTQSELTKLARKYGASPRTIQRWIKDGAPVDSPAKMRDYIEGRKNRPAGYDNAAASKAKGSAAGEVNWGKELKKFQALREEIAYARDRGEVYPAKVVDDAIATALAVLFGSVERIFASEFPASCKGMDELSIKVKALAAVEELREELKSRFDVLSKGGKA